MLVLRLMEAGIDFGLSVTDAVTVSGSKVKAHRSLHRPGPASVDLLDRLLGALSVSPGTLSAIAVSGGRSRELPEQHAGVPIVQVDEPSAAGRGGLALSGLGRGLVVSCGTGTAMILADAGSRSYRHVTGTPVGGGTLEGLASRLIGLRNAFEVAELALSGRASAVDTTLGDVLGGGVGNLPPSATAVSLGRLAGLEQDPSREDLAASLTTMVSQTIALIALNAAMAHAMEDVVFVGRMARLAAVRGMIEAVFRVYRFPTAPVFPEGAELATAYGAALAIHGAASHATDLDNAAILEELRERFER